MIDITRSNKGFKRVQRCYLIVKDKDMKNYSFYTGIDVSKKTLDYCIINSSSSEVLLQGKTANTSEGMISMLAKMKTKKVDLKQTFFCFENTGVYSVPLSVFLSQQAYDYAEVPALEIKKSKGLTRGKNDTTDARDIAFYTLRNRDKIKLSCIPSKEILTLKALLSEREKTVEAIKSYSMSKEIVGFLPDDVSQFCMEGNQRMIKHLKEYLSELDKKIESIIESSLELNSQKELLMSIPGIGKTIAVYIIIATKGFTSFKNSRKFACYAGVAPFEYSSGTSIKGRTKVSPFADKKMKSLLHMAALNALRCDVELKTYYERKKQEGKHTMLILNNVKCKLIGRAFAVINRKSEFVNICKFSA